MWSKSRRKNSTARNSYKAGFRAGMRKARRNNNKRRGGYRW